MAKKIPQRFQSINIREDIFSYRDKVTGLDFVYLHDRSAEVGVDHATWKKIEEFSENHNRQLYLSKNDLPDRVAVSLPPALISRTLWPDGEESPGGIAYKTPAEAVSILTGYGLDLPNEWEIETILCSEARREFLPFSLDDQDISSWMSLNLNDDYPETRSGLTHLFVGEAVKSCTGDVRYKVKTGAAQFWPWQHEEWIWCLAAFSASPDEFHDASVAFRAIYRL